MLQTDQIVSLTINSNVCTFEYIIMNRSLLRRCQRVSTFSVSFSLITLLIFSRSSSVKMFLVFDLSLFVLIIISLTLFSCSTAAIMHALSAHVDCTVICVYICYKLSEFI